MARTKKELVEDIKAAGGPDLNADEHSLADLEAALATANAAADELGATLIAKGTKDADGNTWRTEKEEGGTRVHLLTKSGIAVNVLAATEAEGRTALLASPYAK